MASLLSSSIRRTSLLWAVTIVASCVFVPVVAFAQGSTTTTAKPTTTTAKPTTTAAPTTTAEVTTSLPRTTASTTPVSTATTAAGTTSTTGDGATSSTASTSTTIASGVLVPGPNDTAVRAGSSSGGISAGTKLKLVVAALLALAIGIAVLTFFYWRRTKPTAAIGDDDEPTPGDDDALDQPTSAMDALAAVSALPETGPPRASAADEPTQAIPVQESMGGGVVLDQAPIIVTAADIASSAVDEVSSSDGGSSDSGSSDSGSSGGE